MPGQRSASQPRRLLLPLLIAVAACSAETGPPAAGLQVQRGPGAEGTVGQELEPILFRARGEDDRALPGRWVRFEVARGGGHVVPDSVLSGPDGLLAVTWTLGFLPGPNELAARLDGEPAVRVAVEGTAFRAVAVDAHGAMGCGIREEAAWCWGYGSPFGDHRPTRILPGIRARAVIAGWEAVCALDVAGAVWCTGRNQPAEGARITGLPSLRSLSTHGGMAAFCGLTRADSTAWCWSLRDGVRQLDASRRFLSLDAGGDGTSALSFLCALDLDGLAWCRGSGSSGQLGDGRQQDSDEFVPVAGGLRFSSISAGLTHACGLVASGGLLYCWGDASAAFTGAAPTGSPTPRLERTGVGAMSAGNGAVLASIQGAVIGFGPHFWEGDPLYGANGALRQLEGVPVIEVLAGDGAGGCVRAVGGEIYCSEVISVLRDFDSRLPRLTIWAAVPAVPTSAGSR